MPGGDGWIWPGFTATAPDPYQVWNTTYPAGRGMQATGWTCPGCGRGYSPSVAACWVCPQQPVTATARIEHADVEAGLITQEQKDLSSDQPCLASVPEAAGRRHVRLRRRR